MQGGCSGSGLSGKADGGIRRDDLECAPRCFAHKKRKNFFKILRLSRSAERDKRIFTRGFHPQKHRRPTCGDKPGGDVHERMNVRMIIW